MKGNPKTYVAILVALIVAASIVGAWQGRVQAQSMDDVNRCNPGYGHSALTIALTSAAANYIEGVYIRRTGCNEWSKNFGVLMPGRSIHLFNLHDGEFEVFWREHPHRYGLRPKLRENPPTADEWDTVRTKRHIALNEEAHRRIVVD